MPQYSFDQNLAKGLPGTYCNGRTIPVENPVVAQVTEIDVNGVTTDGTYTIQIYDQNGGELLASFSFVAVSQSAAQIAAGLSAAALADPATRGLLNDTGSDVTDTDSCNLYFRAGGVSYYVVQSSGATVVIDNSTEAGYTAVGAGQLIQSDDAGGWEQWDGDGPAFLGVVLRNSFAINLPNNSNTPDALIGGPAIFDVLYDGEVMVEFAAGVTVAKGDGPVGYDDVTHKWSNSPDGTYVVVEGSQVRSAGTGVQKIYIRGPLHS
jgi:hypothetical protein